MAMKFSSGINFAAAAVLALALLSLAPAVAQIRSAAFEAQSANLDNSRSVVRIAAIEALTQLEDDEEVIVAVLLIAERLRDEVPAVRIAAARQLGHLGELAAAAVPDIGRALADGSYAVSEADNGGVRFRSVAMAAATALTDLGPVALEALNDLLDALRSKDPRLRAAAAKAIGFMGDKVSNAAPALVMALSDPTPETRFEAAYALGQIGPLSAKTIAALRQSLNDTGRFQEALPSGAAVYGSVRVAAAEALLNLGEEQLSIIKRHGGAIRNSDEEEPDLPWLPGRRLRFSADESDIRDLMAVVLRASQLTVSFRRDVDGFLTFDFAGMPAQGAFNMLLNDYNLSYEWDPRRRHVTIVPYQSVYFAKPPLAVAALTKRRPPKARPRKVKPAPAVVKKPAAVKPRKVKARKITAAKAVKPTKKTAAPARKIVVARKPPPPIPVKVAERPKKALSLAKKAAMARKSVPAVQPKAVVKTVRSKPPPTRVAVMAPKTVKTPKTRPPPAKVSKPARTLRKAPAARRAKVPPKRAPPKRVASLRPKAPEAEAKADEPIDISGEHRLSFIIKYDGIYRAMIDRNEYTAGMIFVTGRGALVIEEIRKRAVFLLRKSSSGDERFVIQHRRRR